MLSSSVCLAARGCDLTVKLVGIDDRGRKESKGSLVRS